MPPRTIKNDYKKAFLITQKKAKHKLRPVWNWQKLLEIKFRN